MKRKIMITILPLISILTTMLCSCNWENSGPGKYSDPWNYKMEEAGFYYYLVAEDYGVARRDHEAVAARILGLVDEEKETDELVIPETLGGYPVSQIGAVWGGVMVPYHYYGINGKNIKNIVINHEMYIGDYYDEYGIYNFEGNLIINANLDYPPSYFKFPKEYNQVQFNVKVDQQFLIEKAKQKFQATVIYNNSVCYEQITYGCIVKKGGLLTEPEKPTKNGYTFAGWYKDESYEEPWDFKENTVEEDIILFDKWIKD